MKKCKVAISTNEPEECQICCFFCEKKETCKKCCGDASEFCEEQVEDDSELVLIQKAVPEVLKAITEITIQKKQLEEQEKKMKESLLKAMEEHGVKKFENEEVAFTYVAPTTRSSIDSKKLKEDHPDIAKEYTKTSKVSASVKITVKGDK